MRFLIIDRRQIFYWGTALFLAVFTSGSLKAEVRSEYCTNDQSICFEEVPDVLKLPNLDGERAVFDGQTWSMSWGDANGNLWPDLFLNHHTDRSTVGRFPTSHLIYDPGMAPDSWNFEELYHNDDQHSAVFIDLNNDGKNDILEAIGGLRGNATANDLTTANVAYLGAENDLEGANPAIDMNLGFAGARGRYILPINHNGTLKLLFLNAKREDGQFGSELFAYDTDGTYRQEKIFFKAECIDASCTRSNFNIGDCQDAMQLHINADNIIDLLCLNFADSRGIRVLLGDPDTNSFIDVGGEERLGFFRDGNVVDVTNDGSAEVLLILGDRVGLGTVEEGWFGGMSFNFERLQGLSDGVPVGVVSGDWDNDKDVDFITYQRTEDAVFRFGIWVNDGTGRFTVQEFEDRGNLGAARNVSVADYDLDGALDVLFSDGKKSPEEAIGRGGYILLKGRSTNNWLELDIVDDLNLRGLGSTVTVTADGTEMTRWQYGGVHGEVQDHVRLHFGLADARSVDLKVTWWDGTETLMSGIRANPLLSIQKKHSGVL